MNPDAIFARRLRAARARLGLSQREVGRLMGLPVKVAAPRINQYERGSAAPNIEDLQRLAEGLGVPAAALVVEDDRLFRLLMAWADAPDSARAEALKQLEERVENGNRPGKRAALKRVEQARQAWAAERTAEAAAKPPKRAPVPAPVSRRRNAAKP